jgi:hypothetical protein
MTSQTIEFDLVSEGGVGRPFVLIFEDERDGAFARASAESIAAKSRCLVFRSPRVSDENWGALTEALRATLQSRGVRQGSFVGFGAAGALVQNLCLLEPRTVRAAVLFRASSRAHPRLIDRLVDRLEGALPLGLPLRRVVRGFDSRPFLQRIRCPVLVVSTADDSLEERRDAATMARRMPTAWQMTLQGRSKLSVDGGSDERTAEFAQLVVEFSEVPARAPQKGAAA